NWAGPVTLGNPKPNGTAVSMGAASGTSLIVSSSIAEGTGNAFGITKVDDGTVIFNNANNYTGATTVAAGTLNIRDPQARGLSGRPGAPAHDGATLELEVRGHPHCPDAHGRH